MDADREAEVRAKAHALWESEGRPEGSAERHWSTAEEDLRAEDQDRTQGAPALDDVRAAAEAERAVGEDPTSGPEPPPEGGFETPLLDPHVGTEAPAPVEAARTTRQAVDAIEED